MAADIVPGAQPAIPPQPRPPTQPKYPDAIPDDDEGDSSPAQAEDGVEDQEDAQAVLQPAMSATASHMASPLTPATEKVAAMEKMGPFGGSLPEEDEEDDDGHGDLSPGPPNRHARASLHLGQMPSRGPPSRAPLPSPWHTGPRSLMVEKPSSTFPVQQHTQPRPSRSVFESAFGPSGTRSRSRSAGQDALRKLQKALPSFSTPSHLRPAFSTSFFSSSSSPSNGDKPKSPASGSPTAGTPRPMRRRTGSSSLATGSSTMSSFANAPRPATLRRVTSDESILYHSLSRASSLGDDEQFQDVREMVNMRFKAIRESLPDVPNFRMPSLPKIHAPSFISMNSLSDGLGGNHSGSETTPVERDSFAPAPAASATLKEGQTELDLVLEELTGDVVVMGGFRGSVLRSAEPPYQQCWAPVKLGFNMRKVNLEVGLEDEDEDCMEETIKPSGMLSHIGPIDISRKLFKKLRHCENAKNGKLRVWDYGYDWRLSPHKLSRRLLDFLETLPSNQPGTPADARGALVIAHSLGGMITRHAVNQRPDLFSGVLYAGVPQRCINILGPLRNGDVILLNEKLLTAQVNFSMRTCFVFLPEDGFCFVDKDTGESYPIDFYDPEQWVEWALSPCVRPALPALPKSPALGANGTSFSSLLPNSLRTRARAESKSDRWFTNTNGGAPDPATNTMNGHKDRTIAPQLNPGTDPTTADASTEPPPAPKLSDPERQRYLEYLGRTLDATRTFRAELAHREEHQSANAYPPFALMYGKNTPTVYGAQVHGRDGIPRTDAYDDLLFRAGDGVVLAKESMLPEGYACVKGGRVRTERGHITMLGDMQGVGRALGALLRGRKKGIGKGKEGL
ncbi:uncharacterized protein F5Z01DRAFT_137795 [Emericellopsis atlantica]|uniref:Uncharacterized protein n=1 Tax=Emericellopsis atlantica TaxID=2614577 RepID=A0A9P7ZKT7_9HYPO|nr:uncharacterized protein F5Z01DRAFT_137795 [Emericellopsis atlantica]KAG9253944.1 hypothetical protein F5Z01DRAFT_137795 [Emericellopsis atlantica]